MGGPGKAIGPRRLGLTKNPPQCFPIPEPSDLEELDKQSTLRDIMGPRELNLTGKEH